jgi:aldehyde:ferredoxin oxidoreductase
MSEEERAKLIKGAEDSAEAITGTRKAASVTGLEGKAKAMIYSETLIAIPDMLGVCKHMGITNYQVFNAENLAELYSLGVDKTVHSEELVTAAERIRNVERAFEVREGLTRKDETVPEREFNKEMGGHFKGLYLDRDEFEKAKDDYYTLRGWDTKTAAPTRETLIRLGLDDIAKD